MTNEEYQALVDVLQRTPLSAAEAVAIRMILVKLQALVVGSTDDP
jgi:hypothetical protein